MGFMDDLNEEGDNESIISSNQSTDGSVDEFTRLKSEREKQRRDKAIIKLARSISSNRQSVGSVEFGDAETLLLSELADASRIAMIPSQLHDNKETELGPV